MGIKYNREEHCFIFRDDEGNTTGDSLKYSYLDNYKDNNFEDEPIENYTFTFFYKRDIKEVVDYASVNLSTGDKSRLGWIIPLSLLVTEDDEVKKNPHLSNYIFLSYLYIINNIIDVSNQESFEEVINSESYKYACILVTNNSKLNIDSLLRLELPLAKYGFYRKNLDYVNTHKNQILNNQINILLTKDTINSSGNYIDHYISEVLSTHLTETDPLIKFLFLYQIIEVMLNEILIEKLEKLLSDIRSPTGSMREIDDILKGQTEFVRWTEIEKRAGIDKVKYLDLDKLCNSFVSRTDNLLYHPNSIYKVRNHITHRFRQVVQKKSSIAEINYYFENYLFDLLIGYTIT